MSIGTARGARLLEVGLVSGREAVIVHAMPARNIYLKIVRKGRLDGMPRTVQDILDHADELARRF